MPYSFMSTSHYPSRRAQRLASYDYSTPGAYFVTLCVQDRLRLFGHVESSQVHHSLAGDLVVSLWQEIPDRYPWVTLDTLMVMPDHLHAIVILDGGISAPDSGGPEPPAAVGWPPLGAATTATTEATTASSPPPVSLSELVHHLKARTTARYTLGVREHGWTCFHGTLWQRSFYDRVIRDEDELNRIREYILQNPLRWGIKTQGASWE